MCLQWDNPLLFINVIIHIKSQWVQHDKNLYYWQQLLYLGVATGLRWQQQQLFITSFYVVYIILCGLHHKNIFGTKQLMKHLCNATVWSFLTSKHTSVFIYFKNIMGKAFFTKVLTVDALHIAHALNTHQIHSTYFHKTFQGSVWCHQMLLYCSWELY